MKFRVKYQLMVDPTKGDEVFTKSYTVDADKERDALTIADAIKDAEYDIKYGELSKRCVFDYFIKKIN